MASNTSSEPGGLHCANVQLVAAHQVMEGYGPPYSLVGPAFRWTFGVHFYAIYQLKSVA